MSLLVIVSNRKASSCQFDFIIRTICSSIGSAGPFFLSLAVWLPANIFNGSVGAKLMTNEDTEWPIPHFNCCHFAVAHVPHLCDTFYLDFKTNGRCLTFNTVKYMKTCSSQTVYSIEIDVRRIFRSLVHKGLKKMKCPLHVFYTGYHSFSSQYKLKQISNHSQVLL